MQHTNYICEQNAKVLSDKSDVVIVRLKQSDSWLQYVVHLAVSVNPSQGIYGGTGATLFKLCYKLIRSHTSYLLKSYTHNHEKLKDCPRQKLLSCFHLTASFNIFLLREDQY